MLNQKRVPCPENEELASYLQQKRQELADSPKGLSEKLDMTLSNAYNSVCTALTPIKTLKDLSQIKGVGKWILKLMQGFFVSGPGDFEQENLTNKVKKGKETKRYMPQKNSVAYALLITLYRGTANGNEFMRKQELIDAAEASGLSRVPIGPEKGGGKPAQFGSSHRDWYTGWNCMKTLITKGLVVKSSCPAKYMLTEEGHEVARECLLRSRLSDPRHVSPNVGEACDLNMSNTSHLESVRLDSDGTVTTSTLGVGRQKKPIDIPHESLQRFLLMGYSKEQVLHAFTEVSETSQNKEISTLWPAILCHLREDEVNGLSSEPLSIRKDCRSMTAVNTNAKDWRHCSQLGQVNFIDGQSVMDLTSDGGKTANSYLVHSVPDSFLLRACSSSDYPAKESIFDGVEVKCNTLSMPPLSIGERFEDVYEVILVLDDREQFAVQGSRYGKLIESICKEHKIKIVVRRLPVGDGIWIARHKFFRSEYVLDFIVERKKVDDLRSSIRDHRYKDQKLRLLRCGLKKLIYLVEGDPNSCEAAESIKTACFTTEILEGFDVQRTSCLRDTVQKYGYLTRSITQYYSSQLPSDEPKCNEVCPAFDQFIKRCQDLEKMTVSDVFAIQLMQVPQVTEEIAIAVLDLHPTLLSLARAYSLLDGDVSAQEEMLRKHSNNTISAVASRNIFRLVWGDDH